MNDTLTIKETILQDYTNAVMTLLWCIDNQRQRKLVFSMIEFYPNECLVPETTNEQALRINIEWNNRPLLYFRCIKMSAAAAFSLFEECRNNQKFFMHWETETNKDSTKKEIKATSLLTVPSWPNMALAKRDDTELCPFLPEKWGACRMSHLLTTEPDPLIVTLLAHEEPVKWIKEQLLWDLNEYPELIGSMHMILPNPVYRYIEERLLPGEENNPDKVRIHLALRENQHLSKTMQLLTVERSYFGLLNSQFTDVTEQNTFVELTGRAEEFATAFYSPNHGLLDYTGFGTFLRGIHVDLDIKDAVRIVNIPGTNESYTVPLSIHEKPITVGEPDESEIPEIKLGTRIGYRVRQRKALKRASEFNQFLFNPGDTKIAQGIIRNLIGKARNKVIVVDPYFSTFDFYNYICAVSSHKVKITILTSSLVLRGKSDINKEADEEQKRFDGDLMEYEKADATVNANNDNDKRQNKGVELLQQIDTNGKKLAENEIEVFVMTGEQPIIHDRFLVIDNNVWFSGNSLNRLGERASLLIYLPEPTAVLRLIDASLSNTDKVIPLQKWVIEHNKGVAASEVQNGDSTE